MQIKEKDFIDGKIDIVSLLVKSKLTKSMSETRRVIIQGGISVNGNKITDLKKNFSYKDFDEDEMIINRGSKQFVIRYEKRK
jgi:tyrosyl-tRNA synthetase